MTGDKPTESSKTAFHSSVTWTGNYVFPADPKAIRGLPKPADGNLPGCATTDQLLAQLGGKEPPRPLVDVKTEIKYMAGNHGKDGDNAIRQAEVIKAELIKSGHSEKLKEMEDFVKEHPTDQKAAVLLNVTEREAYREIKDGVDANHKKAHSQEEWQRFFLEGLH